MSDSHMPVPVQNAATDTPRADQLLTVADIAGRIGAHEQTVRHWIKRGELKAAKFGTPHRLSHQDYGLRGLPAPAHAHRCHRRAPPPARSAGPRRLTSTDAARL